jgi:peptidoglycan/xylan/chitin deacetylase (PgdA/CDA1 family)
MYPGLAKMGYLRRCAEPGLAVVTYHGVVPRGYSSMDASLDGSLVTSEALRTQIQLLQRHYNIISPDEFRDWCEGSHKLPQHAVLLTCDDGLENTLTDMLPVLKECGVSCLFFVTAASCDQSVSLLWYEELYLMFLAIPIPFNIELNAEKLSVHSMQERRPCWGRLVSKLSAYDREARKGTLDHIREQLRLRVNWRDQLLAGSGRARRFQLLTAGELRELAASGMSIGAHTVSHPMLSQLPEAAVRGEIADSRIRIEQALGVPVWALAYPFGDAASVSAREVRLAEECGFGCGFMNVGGGFGAEFARFAIPRVHVTKEMSLAEFEAHVSGFYRSMRERFSGSGKGMVASVHA